MADTPVQNQVVQQALKILGVPDEPEGDAASAGVVKKAGGKGDPGALELLLATINAHLAGDKATVAALKALREHPEALRSMLAEAGHSGVQHKAYAAQANGVHPRQSAERYNKKAEPMADTPVQNQAAGSTPPVGVVKKAGGKGDPGAPELLLAILEAHMRGDKETVQVLTALAKHPESLQSMLAEIKLEAAVEEKRIRMEIEYGIAFDATSRRWVKPTKPSK